MSIASSDAVSFADEGAWSSVEGDAGVTGDAASCRSIRDSISEGVGEGTGVDAGVAINDIISESVGDLGGVDAGEVADFAGDDGTAGADPVDGDAGAEGCFESAIPA